MQKIISHIKNLGTKIPLSPAETSVAGFVVCALIASLSYRVWTVFIAPSPHIIPAEFHSVDSVFAERSRAVIVDAGVSDGTIYSPSSSVRKTLPPLQSVDLNSATAETLRRLPCVGPALAARIIAFRSATPFRHVSELQRVEGIGPRKWGRIKPYLKTE